MIRRPPRSTLFPLHDALPISGAIGDALGHRRAMLLSDVARVALIGAVPVLLDLGAALIVAYVCVFLAATLDRKSTRLNSSHLVISYAVFCLKKKTIIMA